MTFKVHLLPSDHEFTVEPGDTLLEGALRSGLNVRYNCSSGSCGDCRARLVSGELGNVQHFDYVFKREEKADKQFLMCRAEAGSDLVIEAVEARSSADIPLQQIQTQVAKLKLLSDNIMSLQLRTPRSQTLWFLAGQHATLHIKGLKPRNKSVASCPCNGMLLEFHVRRRPGDEFSDYVFEKMKLKDKIAIEGPFGHFTLDEESGRPIIFVAFETGFAPIKSVIEHAISLETNVPIHLYWVAPDNQGHYLENVCRSWETALDDYHYYPLVGSGANPDWRPPEIVEDIDVAQLTDTERTLLHAGTRIVADFPDLSGFDVYVNGPEKMLLPMEKLLLKHALPRERLFIDHIQHY